MQGCHEPINCSKSGLSANRTAIVPDANGPLTLKSYTALAAVESFLSRLPERQAVAFPRFRTGMIQPVSKYPLVRSDLFADVADLTIIPAFESMLKCPAIDSNSIPCCCDRARLPFPSISERGPRALWLFCKEFIVNPSRSDSSET